MDLRTSKKTMIKEKDIVERRQEYKNRYSEVEKANYFAIKQIVINAIATNQNEAFVGLELRHDEEQKPIFVGQTDFENGWPNKNNVKRIIEDLNSLGYWAKYTNGNMDYSSPTFHWRENISLIRWMFSIIIFEPWKKP